MKQISLNHFTDFKNIGGALETYLIPGTSQDFGREDSMGNWSTEKQINQLHQMILRTQLF